MHIMVSTTALYERLCCKIIYWDYIFLPVFIPVIRFIGVDQIHFGIIMTVNLANGQVTPPGGVNLVAASGVSNVGIRTISKAAFPYYCWRMHSPNTYYLNIPELSLFLQGFF